MKRAEIIRDRFLGCLIGAAIGDALGGPFEMQPRHFIELKYGGQVREMTGGGHLKLAAGEWTDDTAQLVLVIEAWLANRGFEGFDIAFRLGELLDSGVKGIGTELGDLIRILAEDAMRWEEVGRQAWYESAGVLSNNSALSRGVGIALTALNDMDRLLDETVKAVQITHYDPRCVEAALVVNFLVVQLVRNSFRKDMVSLAAGYLDNLRRDQRYREQVRGFDQRIVDSHANITPATPFSQDPDAVPKSIRKVSSMSREDLNTSPYVLHTLECALWALTNAESFEDGVSSVVSLGGDADTQGCIAGALLGARFGLAGIPSTWTKALRERPRLISLGEQVLTLVGDDL